MKNRLRSWGFGLALALGGWGAWAAEIAPEAGWVADHGCRVEVLSYNPAETGGNDVYLFVRHPATPPAPGEKAPLLVGLHWMGGDPLSCAVQAATKPGIYNAPKDFYVFYADSLGDSGWWGGAMGWRGGSDEPVKVAPPQPQAVEKRLLAEIEWIKNHYPIDENRIYLAGNSMGGSGALGIGLPHGELFAAVKVSVPAGVEHALARMYFKPLAVPEGTRLADPPICVDYSSPNDRWSGRHEVLYENMRERRYALIGFWGPWFHMADDKTVLAHNDLVHAFDWFSIRRDEAYPVFTHATSDDTPPWPGHFADNDYRERGQVNGFFRWKAVKDEAEGFALSLYLVDPQALDSKHFTPPAEATADVTVRRIQHFAVAPGEKVKWRFGGATGEVEADADGKVTVPGLNITRAATALQFSK